VFAFLPVRRIQFKYHRHYLSIDHVSHLSTKAHIGH
jgi:hypothetical protein